jgi:hypothetical protein
MASFLSWENVNIRRKQSDKSSPDLPVYYLYTLLAITPVAKEKFKACALTHILNPTSIHLYGSIVPPISPLSPMSGSSTFSLEKGQIVSIIGPQRALLYK